MSQQGVVHCFGLLTDRGCNCVVLHIVLNDLCGLFSGKDGLFMGSAGLMGAGSCGRVIAVCLGDEH